MFAPTDISRLTRLYKKSENDPILKSIEYAPISSFNANVHRAAYKSRLHEREIAMPGIDVQNHLRVAHIAFKRPSFLQKAFYTSSTSGFRRTPLAARRPASRCSVARALELQFLKKLQTASGHSPALLNHLICPDQHRLRDG